MQTDTIYIWKNTVLFDKMCETFDGFKKAFEQRCKQQWDDEFKTVTVSSVDSNESNQFYWTVAIPKKDIVAVSILVPNVWHTNDVFDGNPRNYFVIEDNGKEWKMRKPDERCDQLRSDTIKFMYLVNPENI